MAVIMVGAMLVASINTVWQQKMDRNNIITQSFSESIRLEKGEELGYFKLGSTVIVLFTQDKISWEPNLQENSLVLMRGLLGTTR